MTLTYVITDASGMIFYVTNYCVNLLVSIYMLVYEDVDVPYFIR